MTEPMTPTFAALVSLLTCVIAGTISWNVYRLQKIQREETWLKALWEFQRSFWQDERMEQVRAWIACDAAYVDLRPILIKRMDIENQGATPSLPLSTAEYKSLETLDRFAALLLGYMEIAPKETGKHGSILSRMFDDYWLKQITDVKRSELRWYLRTFYKELPLDGLRVPL